VKRVRQAWFRGHSWGAQDRSEIQSNQKDQEHQLKEHRVHRRPEALASRLEDPRCQAHTRHALELVRVLQKLRGEHPIVAHLCNPGRMPKQRSSLAGASPGVRLCAAYRRRDDCPNAKPRPAQLCHDRVDRPLLPAPPKPIVARRHKHRQTRAHHHGHDGQRERAGQRALGRLDLT